jgi:aminoglycoside phosphotransferase (APT) family kinase protein
MDNTILKTAWERFIAPLPLDFIVTEELLKPYTSNVISHIEFISHGGVNSNYKINFAKNHAPLLLRIYTRKNAAAKLEQAVHHLVATHQIPVPKTFYVGVQADLCPYPYAIMEWITGRTFRDVLLSNEQTAIAACAYEAGKCLNILRHIHFENINLFQDGLTVPPLTDTQNYLPIALALLSNSIVNSSLGEPLSSSLEKLLLSQHSLLLNGPISLAHGDYDPSNILVRMINGKWQITAILDWELAMAGNYLLDVGLMLRYCHKLPAIFENKFIEGLQSTSELLPSQWKKMAMLENILNLLNVLAFSPFSLKPNRNQDAVELITHVVQNWENL